MTVHSFVYSNNPRYRVFRHIVFWAVWIIYLVIITVMARTGASLIGFWPFVEYCFIEMLIATSVDMLLCYSVLYLLMPKFLLAEKYFYFFLGLALFLLLDAALSSYFYTWLINPIRTQLYHLPEMRSATFTNLLHSLPSIMMMTSIGMVIKFYKMWNVKKQELYLAKSEKMSRELKFVDTYIQPSFLPIMLKKIYAFSFSTANRVPDMIQQLQNIMSYLIDECNRPSVALSREIESIRNFIQLERLTNANGLTIEFEQTGDTDNLRIVPYLLFPLVENNFRQINDNITDKHWVNITIQVEGSRVILVLKNSKPVETSNLFNYETANLQQMRKRMDLLYPGSYKMNIIIEENTFIIRLEIDLSKVVN